MRMLDDDEFARSISTTAVGWYSAPTTGGVLGIVDAPAVGVTAVLAAEASESPAAFVATTVNVYAVLFVRPTKSHCSVGGGEVDADRVHARPSGDEVTR
jgi:hypothetical protein